MFLVYLVIIFLHRTKSNEGENCIYHVSSVLSIVFGAKWVLSKHLLSEQKILSNVKEKSAYLKFLLLVLVLVLKAA